MWIKSVQILVNYSRRNGSKSCSRRLHYLVNNIRDFWMQNWVLNNSTKISSLSSWSRCRGHPLQWTVRVKNRYHPAKNKLQHIPKQTVICKEYTCTAQRKQSQQAGTETTMYWYTAAAQLLYVRKIFPSGLTAWLTAATGLLALPATAQKWQFSSPSNIFPCNKKTTNMLKWNGSMMRRLSDSSRQQKLKDRDDVYNQREKNMETNTERHDMELINTTK